MEHELNYDNWYELRNLVLEASWSKKLVEPSFSGYESVVEKIKNYLTTGEESSLEFAAQEVANLCPDATSEGKKAPWLLLEKS